jgi:hypothetical protein
MSIDTPSSSYGRAEQAEGPTPFQVPTADIAQPALPRLQSFEELGLAGPFQKAVEEELSRDEKLIWVGRPTQSQTIQPPKTILMVVGAVCLGLAMLLPLLFKGVLIFAAVLTVFGLFFLFAPKLFKGVSVSNSGYHACYVVTNRRAILFEKGFQGVDPTNIGSLTEAWKSLTAIRRKSYHPHDLLGMERRNNEQAPGTGDLIFEYIFTIGQTYFPGSQGKVQQTNTPQRTPRGFFFLDQAVAVENLIHTTLLSNLENSLDQGAPPPAPEMRPAREEDRSPPAPAVSAPSTATCACGAAIQAPDDLVGQSVKCPQCGSTLQIPSRAAAKTAAGAGPPYREDGQVPADLKEKALAELGTNERLVWIAQPVPTIIFRRSLGYLIGGGIAAVLALLLLVAGLFAKSAVTTTAVKKGVAAPKVKAQTAAGITNPLALIMLVGGACCMGVPIYRSKMAKGSWYALTNRRAVVYQQGLFGPTRESYSPAEVACMRRSDSWLSESGGDLIFRTVKTITTSYNQRGGSSSRVSTKQYGFLGIAHVKDVEKLVRETLINPFVDKLQAANSL